MILKLLSTLVLTFTFFFSFSQDLIQSRIMSRDINTNGFKIYWNNAEAVDSYIRYGKTPDLELGTLSAGITSSPVFIIANGSPSDLYYVQARVEKDGEEEVSDTLVFITASNSSGDIKVYFNQTVDTDYAHENNEAIQLPQAIDDTLVEYINRAEESIDLAIYNTTSSGSVADYIGALNAAHDRGVTVRVIYNGDTGNTGIDNLDPAIPKLESPEADFDNNIGIMHNKFLVIDVNAVDDNLPLIWTGSTNLTTQQINTDPNHVVIIQDRSLAIAYTLEFEEMWGSNTSTPDEENSKFGPDKKDNTPHFFNINGTDVECYFSPSDKTESRILKAIDEVDNDLLVNTMLITRFDLANAIIDRHNQGIEVAVQLNTMNQSFTFDHLKDNIAGRLAEYSGPTGMLHHKTMLGNAFSDEAPFVLTGSHNWSQSAEFRNDENTLIIYDSKITNQFLQEFMARHKPIVSQLTAVNDTAFINSDEVFVIDVAENDDYYFTIKPSIKILTQPAKGESSGSSQGILTYKSNGNYNGLDSLQYLICNETIETYCDTAWVYLEVDYPLSTVNSKLNMEINVFPNPASKKINIQPNDNELTSFRLINSLGTIVLEKSKLSSSNNHQVSVDKFNKGVYILELTTDERVLHKRIIIN